MESHARRNWRATAWLLERENPEQYGRRPASSCSAFRFEEALRTVLEAALETAAPEDRAAVYQRINAACEGAFKWAFPTYDPTGRQGTRPARPTPLADAEHLNNIRNGGGLHVPDEVPSMLLRPGRVGAMHPPSTFEAQGPPHAEPGNDPPTKADANGHCAAPVGCVGRPRQPMESANDDGLPLRGDPILRLAVPLTGSEPEVNEAGNSRRVGAVHPPSPLPAQGPHHAEPLEAQPPKAGASPQPTATHIPAFTPRLSYRYPLRTAATLNELDRAARASSITERFLSLLSRPTPSDTTSDSAPSPSSHSARKE
jgi:hypothetical protein